jgi:hypothetical protein
MNTPAAWHDVKRFLVRLFPDAPDRGGRLNIAPRPFAVQRTPNSILDRRESHTARTIGGRERLASCSGVAWFHGTCLATVSMLGRMSHSYLFDPSTRQLTLLQAFGAPECIVRPEQLSVSPNGRLLAISSTTGLIALYRVDRET